MTGFGQGDAASAGTQVFSTMVLPGFLARLRANTGPVVIDFGSAIGSNVALLGDELGCKLFVEDLLADLDQISARGASDPDTESPSNEIEAAIRLSSHADASVDGVLCWDVLEYLEREDAQLLASEIRRVLRPGGVVLVSYRAAEGVDIQGVTYEIIDETHLRHRRRGGARQKRRVLQVREMTQLFEPLSIAESVLLKSRMREMLFRKPRAVKPSE